jgi:hypothetical protein
MIRRSKTGPESVIREIKGYFKTLKCEEVIYCSPLIDKGS